MASDDEDGEATRTTWRPLPAPAPASAAHCQALEKLY